MPYHKKRKTNRPQRGLVPENVMRTAMAAVLEGQGVNTVARDMGIDRMTLKRYVRKTRANPDTVCRPNYVTQQVFNDEQEKALSDYLLHASNLHYGLSTKTTRKLAYEFGIAVARRIPQSWESSKCAGKDWLRSFMSRRSELSLRTSVLMTVL